MNKIKRKKLVPKLMLLAILLITVFTGFACTFAVAKDNQRSTKLAFEAVETMPWPEGWVPLGEPWGNGKFTHQIYKKTATLVGTIDEIGAFSGDDILYLHVRMDLETYEVISIGKATLYIYCDNGLEGSFYGTVVSKGVAGVALDGKLTLQGTGDFEGWKLFGEVWLEWGPVNGLAGTILVPN